MMIKNKIDLTDSSMWQSLDWDEKEVHPNLKRTDRQVNVARANKLKANNPEFRKAMVEAKTGKKRLDMLGENNPAHTAEEKQRRRNLFLGVKKSPEHIKNWQEANKNLPILTCPHCGLESKNRGNMNRYHFDNCKLKCPQAL